MLALLILILFVMIFLGLLNIIGHVIVYTIFGVVMVLGFVSLKHVDYHQLIAIGFVLIALKLFIDAIKK